MASTPLRQPVLPFERVELRPPEDGTPDRPGVPTPAVTVSTAPPSGVPVSPPVSPSGATVVEYVRHPRARRYLIRVRLDGTVRATIPRGGSRREAARFVESHAGWVAEQQAIAARARASRRPGRPVDAVRLARQRAQRELPPRLHALAAQFGLTVARVSIRNQRWRWGSCSKQAHICLNWRLVEMPDWVRDYVLIHELMHLRRMDHSPAFWTLVSAACPDYRRARQWLREHGRGLSED